jgi:hypothetical protein
MPAYTWQMARNEQGFFIFMDVIPTHYFNCSLKKSIVRFQASSAAALS